jgi:hypothetical protein
MRISRPRSVYRCHADSAGPMIDGAWLRIQWSTRASSRVRESSAPANRKPHTLGFGISDERPPGKGHIAARFLLMGLTVWAESPRLTNSNVATQCDSLFRGR